MYVNFDGSECKVGLIAFAINRTNILTLQSHQGIITTVKITPLETSDESCKHTHHCFKQKDKTDLRSHLGNNKTNVQDIKQF